MLPAVNVSGDVSITSSALTYNRISKTGSETITLKNNGGMAISGPLEVALAISNPSVTAIGNTGTYQNNPYWTVTTGTLAPGASASITVSFFYAVGTSFSTSPTVYSGGLN